MFPEIGDFDTTTVIDAWHKSGEEGRSRTRKFTRGQRLISIGRPVEKFFLVFDGAIQPTLQLKGVPLPGPVVKTSLIQKPPSIMVIGAKDFFTRQSSDRDWIALNDVDAKEIDSRSLMTMYRQRDPGTRLPAVWPTVRALVCASDISDVLKEVIGERLGVDPNQGFADKQYDKIFSAFPEYPKMAMETIYQMLVERDKDADEPSLVYTPPHVAAQRGHG